MDDKWTKLKERIIDDLTDYISKEDMFGSDLWFEGYDECLREILRHMARLEKDINL